MGRKFKLFDHYLKTKLWKLSEFQISKTHTHRHRYSMHIFPKTGILNPEFMYVNTLGLYEKFLCSCIYP